MPRSSSDFRVKLDHVLVATDFSPASRAAVLYATSIARRHRSMLVIAHVVASSSQGTLMDGWRAGQAQITELLLANRLDGFPHELIVKSGDIWSVVSGLVADRQIDLVIVGTRGRTGITKLILGSVAETIFRQSVCPVLTVGPNVADQDPELAPKRILAATGFAAHSVNAVRYAINLSLDFNASVALLNVVTQSNTSQEPARSERINKLRELIPSNTHLASEPLFLVEFGSAPEKILETALAWKANLIVLGLRSTKQADKTTAAKAYEVISKASCPVLTVHGPE